MRMPGFSFVLPVALFILVALKAHPAYSQTTPFLSDTEIRMLANELSGDRAYEHIRVLSQWHRDSGMEGFFLAADYVMTAARDAGLEDVRFIEQEMDGQNYTAKAAELWMIEPIEVKLADIGEHAVYLADGSHDADVIAELVWVGNASKDTLRNIDVKGKIVLTNGSPGSAAANAVWGKGAVGVVSYQTSESRNPLDVPDQIAWGRIAMTPPAGKQGTFAFMLPPRKGDILKKILDTDQMQDYFATGKKTKGGRVVLRAKVDTEIGKKPGRTGFVEGWIKGSKYHDQQIVITAHLQEEQGSANDDGSGCGNILEIARTLNKLIKEGRIERPLRDIRFWWTDEISSEYRYFQANPEEPKKFLANLHQDMVGANQAMGSRVQHLIFGPHSRTSYLDAIFESIGNFLILSNNGYLAASRAGGYPRPFTRPLYSTRGTRDGYNARFVPYFNPSDHMCFVEGIIGVPAVATINWDDPYIHSSDDDLFQIDQTQLKRNQFLIGSSAYVLAFADESMVPLLASETFAAGHRRLANDLTVALQVINQSESATADAARFDAENLIESGTQREIRAMNSIKVFAGNNEPALQVIDAFAKQMQSKLPELSALVSEYSIRRNGTTPNVAEEDTLKARAKKSIPRNPESLKTYFERRGNVPSSGNLHSLMRDEVYNFVDGTRSYFDIYKAVRAEQLAGGSWYYGDVTLQDVVGLLDASVKANVLILR